MLVLSRKKDEAVIIGPHGEVKVVVLGVVGGNVKLGFEAPLEIPVHREEIYLKIQKDKRPKKRDD